MRQDVEASALQAQLDYVCTVLDFLDTLSGKEVVPTSPITPTIVEASALQAQLDYVCTVLDFLDTLSGAVQSSIHSKALLTSFSHLHVNL